VITHPAWPEPIARGLSEMIARHGVDADDYDPLAPPIAAFDFDDTCIRGDISHETLHLLDHDDPAGRVAHYEAACAADLYAAYRELVHTLVAGRTVEQVRELAERALQRGQQAGTLALRDEMHELVSALQAHGWWVRVVTASPTTLVQPLAGRYGIPPEHVLGMTSRQERGRFLAELLEPVPIAAGKVDVLLAHTQRPPTFMAGDSRSDEPLMRASRYALLRHHDDTGLRDDALRLGWWVMEDP
jgi:phosphoserine phosphatase